MTYNEILNQLDRTMIVLQKERNKLIELIDAENEKELKELKWTSNCTATIDIDIDMYKLHLIGPIPQVEKPTIIIKSPIYHYFDLIWVPKESHFFTTCDKLFTTFLQNTKFKELKYNEIHYSILDIAMKTK